jgi:MoaA/NifB/PqqE/SkfB family radical SAM enzyme
MPLAVVEKIARELGELNYAGNINSNMYNEPLTDVRLAQIYRILKKAVPKCRIRLLTNGDYLSPERADELFDAGLDSIRITDHNPVPNQKLKSNVEAIANKYPGKDITLNRLEGQLRNRGGTIKHEDAQAPAAVCWPRGHSRAYIDFLGNMIGCCDDPFSTKIFGNVASEKLLDIWNSAEYVRFRDGLDSGRYYYKFCKDCNFNAGKQIQCES